MKSTSILHWMLEKIWPLLKPLYLSVLLDNLCLLLFLLIFALSAEAYLWCSWNPPFCLHRFSPTLYVPSYNHDSLSLPHSIPYKQAFIPALNHTAFYGCPSSLFCSLLATLCSCLLKIWLHLCLIIAISIKKCLRHINSPSPSFMRGIRGFFFLHFLSQ